jgi:FAD/FMN-containing dehydrogenase
MTTQLAPETLRRFEAVVGASGIITSVADMAPYLKEWRGLWHGETPVILRPKTTAEVQELLVIAHETETKIVPQSGNTGLVGGQIPSKGEVLLSLDRMTQILDVDASEFTLVAQAGATLQSIQSAADQADRLFPLSLASQGSCRIGGNMSTNAGGLNVLAYGTARDLCLGLEVVLADGSVLNLLKKLRKDNTGYDLKQLFIGAEGTLGIITAVALKLFPKPQHYETAFVAIDSPEQAMALLELVKAHSGNRVVAFELLAEIGVQFTTRHMHTRRALETVSPWYVLFELADVEHEAAKHMLALGFERGILNDAVLAQSNAQRAELWSIRENLSESQKFEGGSIKHDISVPLAKIPQFIAEASAAVQSLVPGCRPCCFGHMGDGNIHFNVSQPIAMAKDDYLAQWPIMSAVVHDIVAKLGGSFSAEHGIGVLKTADMQRYKSANELAAMKALKIAFDPKNILNPGRILG